MARAPAAGFPLVLGVAFLGYSVLVAVRLARR
jgi:hypothetical protein